jgi:hypothetical protein
VLIVTSSLASDVGVALIGFCGLLITALVTFLGTRMKLLHDERESRRSFRDGLAREYDLALRSDRIGSYRSLWRLLRPLRRFDPPRLTVGDAHALRSSLGAWYYEEGLFLSNTSWSGYGNLQEAITRVIASAEGGCDRLLTDDEFKTLYERARVLRSSLTEDIATRERSVLESKDKR